jgi:tRNA (cytosine38-C5)-methyltransferase
LRYYLLARFEPFSIPVEISTAQILRCIPGRGIEWIDDRDQSGVMPGARAVSDYLDQEVSGLDDCTIPPRALEKWGRLFDIVLPASYRTCCFTGGPYFGNRFSVPSDLPQGIQGWSNEPAPSSRRTSC